MRKVLRSLGLSVARAIGTRLVDFQSGRDLGKALIIPWRGKIHVIGLEATVRPVFLPQNRLTFWKQKIGFTVPPQPDYPNERSTSRQERVQDGP